MKRVPANELRKAREQMAAKKKVKITGTASSTPKVSGSMGKSQPKTATKPKAPSIVRKAPTKAPASGARRLLPRDINAAPSPRRLLANSALAASAPKRVATAAKKAAANPKVTKRAPLEMKRFGGVFAVPVKPKKTIY